MIKRALTNTGWLMGARGINAALSLVYLALATRALGLEGFGQFILCVSFAQAVVGFTTFQTWQVVVRWGQKEEDLPDATGFALALDFLTIVVGTAAAALILFLSGDWLPVPEDLRASAFWFTFVALLSIRSTPAGILRLHDRYAKAATADSITSITRVIGASIVMFFDPRIETFLMVWGCSELATAAMHWILARQSQPIFWRSFSLLRIPGRGEKAWNFVAGTSLSAMLTIISRQVLVLLVGALGGAAVAGIYRVAAQLGEGVLKLAQAVLKATYPELLRTPEAAKTIAKKITRIATITGLFTVIFSLLAGRWLIDVIAGDEFAAAYLPMILLSAAAAIELAGASLEALLVARKKALTNLLLRAIPTGLALVSLIWLIETNGAAGAAFAVLAASAVSVTGLTLANKRYGKAGE